MVEGMSIVKHYEPLTSLEGKKHIKSSTDYFKHVTPIKNPVYKFEFDFNIFVNGIPQNNP
jgi:hypothetical protein